MEELLFEDLPMRLNLSDSDVRNHIGWASAFQNSRTGETRIEIRLSEEASKKLRDLTQIFDLKAIGFAGYMKENY